MKITIEDKIMGGGKTYNAIEEMKVSKNSFMYITPFLDEVDRVLKEVKNSYAPNNRNKDGSKRTSLLNMANNSRNIVSTHALFKMLTRDDYGFFKDYDLILDEVVDPIEMVDITTYDIHMLINDGHIVINEKNSCVTFVNNEYEGKFDYLKELCSTSNVIYVNDTFLVWNFPIEIFKGFNSVKILTYLFEGSVLKSYFDYYGIKYTINKHDDTEKKKEIKKLLNIYQGNGNYIGNKPTAFSVNWFKRTFTKEQQDKLKIKTQNIFARDFKTKSTYNAYTTFKENQKKVKGGGYSNGFIPVNSRATNEYDYIKSMAYLANRYMNPSIVKFFYDGGVSVNQEQWALSELVQWVWRGCIRKKEPMNLYIPSKRMRNILINWLNN